MDITTSLPAQKKSNFMPMLIIGALYFIYGFVTWINGILIPYLKVACQLKTSMEAYLVATAFLIAYPVMAIPSSLVLHKTGYKKGMSLGLLIMAIGAVIFIPAAHARSYALFLTGLFVTGTGMALLQTASNPYISKIGPIESAATRISIMGLFNKGAGIIASLVFGYIALKGNDQLTEKLKTMSASAKDIALNELAGRVVVPYILMSVLLVIFSIAILFSSLPDIEDNATDDKGNIDFSAGKKNVFQFPHLMLGVLAMFLYVGVEVIAGDTIISYGTSIGIAMTTAKYFTTATLVCMLVGYVIGIFAIPKYITQQRALRICAIIGIIFSILAVITSKYVSVGFIAALGLANSLMWPALFPLAIKGLGKFTKTGSALMIMGIAGGALLPLLYAWISGKSTSQLAYLILLPCYLYILYYAIVGHKKGLVIKN